jgi:methylglyoxal synthase
MDYKNIAMTATKKIALVAHDNKKQDLFAWAKYNRNLLERHKLYATGTTGRILAEELELKIVRLESGQLGGDQQIGAKIAEGEVDFVIFFWDPLEPLPHDPDIKALLRVAMVWNIPVACNRSSADFMISSPLMESGYLRWVPDYTTHRARFSNAGSDGTAA